MTIRISKIIIIDKQDKQNLIKILTIMVKKTLQSDEESKCIMILPRIFVCLFADAQEFGGSAPDDRD